MLRHIFLALLLSSFAGIARGQSMNDYNEKLITSLNEGDYDKAIKWGIEAKKAGKTEVEESHPDYVMVLHNLGYCYFLAKDYEKSGKLYAKALDLIAKHKENSYPVTSNLILHTAQLNEVVGQLDEAGELYLIYASIFENDLQQQEEYALAMNTAGMAFYNNQDYKKAKPAFEKAVSVFRVLPNSELNLMTSLSNLALSHNNLYEFKEARKYLEEDVALIRKLNMVKTQDFVIAASHLALIYRSLRDFQAALDLYIETEKVAKEVYGECKGDHLTIISSLGVLYTDLEKFSEAQYWLQLEVKERAKAGDQGIGFIRANNNLGLSYFYQKDFVNAERYIGVAASLAQKTVDKSFVEYPNYISNMGLVCDQLGRFPESIKYYEEAIESCKLHKGLHPSYPTILNNLANAYRQLDRYTEAEETYLECIRLNEQNLGAESGELVKPLTSLSVVYSSMGRFEEAQNYAKRAAILAAKDKGKLSNDYQICLNNIAHVYLEVEEFALAEETYLEIVELSEQSGTKNWQPYNNLGDFYMSIGQDEKAEKYFLKALGVCRELFKKDNHQTALVLTNIGLLYTQMNRYKEAGKILEEALAIQKTVYGDEVNNTMLSTMANLTFVYEYNGEIKKAIETLEFIVKEKEKKFSIYHPEYALALNNLAIFHYQHGNADKGLELLLEAQRNFVVQNDPHHSLNALFLSSIAELYESTGEYNKVLVPYRESLDITLNYIDKNFVNLSNQEKETFWNEHKDEFERFNSTVIHLADYEKDVNSFGYNYLLDSKALLLNSTSRIQQHIRSSSDETLKERYELWKEKKSLLAKAYDLSKRELKNLGLNIQEIEDELNSLEKYLSKATSVFDTTMVRKDWRVIQKHLGEDEAAIEMTRFRFYNDGLTDSIFYGAYIITKQSQVPDFVVLRNGVELEDVYLKFYNNSRIHRLEDKRSYGRYWEPIASKLGGIRKVWIAPDGVYNQINLNTLLNPENSKYLIEEWELHQLTSTYDLVELSAEGVQSDKSAVILGRPKYHISGTGKTEVSTTRYRGSALLSNAVWTDLPGTERETKAVVDLLKERNWKVHQFLGDQAREEQLKEVRSPGVLHIATHGFFIPTGSGKEEADNPMLRSGLVLAGVTDYLVSESVPDGDDGILTAYETTLLNLNNTDLVVLSACETGLGEVVNGEGVYGLQRGFHVAGARSMLMSLWKVDDQATQELMNIFYREWIGGKSKREAFRDAQIIIKDKYEDVMYWGAFVLIGE